jgi:hypothetical protein
MIIQALALVKKNMFQDKEEADNLKKKKKKLMKLIDWDQKLKQLLKKKPSKSSLMPKKEMLKPKPLLKKKPRMEKERKTKRKRKLLQLKKKLQNQRLQNMMLKSRNNTLNQKSKPKKPRKLKKKRSRLNQKNNQLRLKIRKLLRHQPKSRHQPQLQSKRTMITKIHTMRKNTHLRMTKPL